MTNILASCVLAVMFITGVMSEKSIIYSNYTQISNLEKTRCFSQCYGLETCVAAVVGKTGNFCKVLLLEEDATELLERVIRSDDVIWIKCPRKKSRLETTATAATSGAATTATTIETAKTHATARVETRVTTEDQTMESNISTVTLEAMTSTMKAELNCPEAFDLTPHGCFFVPVYGRTWNEGQTDCSTYGTKGSLAQTNNQEKLTTVWNLVQNYGIGVAWIGATAEDDQGIKFTTGGEVGGGLWGAGEPRLGNGDCVAVAGGRLYMSDCNEEMYYVCEMLM